MIPRLYRDYSAATRTKPRWGPPLRLHGYWQVGIIWLGWYVGIYRGDEVVGFEAERDDDEQIAPDTKRQWMLATNRGLRARRR